MATKQYDWDGKGYGRRIAKPAAKLREVEPMASDQHVFGVAITALRGECLYTCAAIMKAATRGEVRGEAMRFALRAYPPREGYVRHNVCVSFPDSITDPDGPINLTTE